MTAPHPPAATPPPGPPEGSGESDSAGSRRKPFLLRLPPALMSELREWSGQELRSLNAHLEFLLRDAVRQHRRAAKKKDAEP